MIELRLQLSADSFQLSAPLSAVSWQPTAALTADN
jgi:hypothetical protein